MFLKVGKCMCIVMSGAAARTGILKEKNVKNYIKIMEKRSDCHHKKNKRNIKT